MRANRVTRSTADGRGPPRTGRQVSGSTASAAGAYPTSHGYTSDAPAPNSANGRRRRGRDPTDPRGGSAIRTWRSRPAPRRHRVSAASGPADAHAHSRAASSWPSRLARSGQPRLLPAMRPLPARVSMKTLLRLRRHEHDRAIRGSALPCRPHLLEPLHLRAGPALTLQAPIARLDPLALGAGPCFRPKRDETQAAGATDSDSHQSNRIVAETDDARGRDFF
jgi:hypothetical protein